MKIPLTTEIETYMRERKPEWPDGFVRYYSERFFNHYQAQGWKLSNGNAMKDWKAAFNSNWQFLKFKEDVDYLEKEKGGAVKKMSPLALLDDRLRSASGEAGLELLDELLTSYKHRRENVSEDSLYASYGLMNKYNFIDMLVTKTQQDFIMGVYANTVRKGIVAVAKQALETMINHSIRFSDYDISAQRRANFS